MNPMREPTQGWETVETPTRQSALSKIENGAIVLVVDDAPNSLRMLCDALEQEGYEVLVALDGFDARERFEMTVPDIVLLDAVMPGMSGFELCRTIKAESAFSHVPVIFMTGLTETEHIVEGFSVGAVDYVVKPLKIPEVLARVSTHLHNAQVTRLAREAVDLAGLGVVLLDSQGRIAWQSPQASLWLDGAKPRGDSAGDSGWLGRAIREENATRLITRDGRALVARYLGAAGLGETMILLRLADSAVSELSDRLTNAALTPRETEVLSWLAKGKTNRDIADILAMSPRTVNKHLEHIFEKLGVETRTSAAALALKLLE
jgi:DNA-binding NarL/FixJ family response regulator